MAGLRHLGWQSGCPSDTLLGGEPAAASHTDHPMSWLWSTRSHVRRGLGPAFHAWVSLWSWRAPRDRVDAMAQYSALPHEGVSWTFKWHSSQHIASLMWKLIGWISSCQSCCSENWFRGYFPLKTTFLENRQEERSAFTGGKFNIFFETRWMTQRLH